MIMENNWKCKAPAFGNLGSAHRSPGQTQVNRMQWSNWSKKMELITTCSQALMQPLFYCLFARLLYSSTTSFQSASRPKDAQGLYWHWIARFLVVFKHQCQLGMQQFMQQSMQVSMKQSVKQTVPKWKLETKSAKYLPRHKCRMLSGFEGKHWLVGHGALQSCNEPRWAHSGPRPPCFPDPASLDWQTENISDANVFKMKTC